MEWEMENEKECKMEWKMEDVMECEMEWESSSSQESQEKTMCKVEYFKYILLYGGESIIISNVTIIFVGRTTFRAHYIGSLSSQPCRLDLDKLILLSLS